MYLSHLQLEKEPFNIGTGKTTLIKRLVKIDDVAAIFVTVNDPNLSGLDFYNILAVEFAMGRRFDDREAFLAAFTQNGPYHDTAPYLPPSPA